MVVLIFSTPGQSRRKGSTSTGTQSCSIHIVREQVPEKWYSQPDGNPFHKEIGGYLLPNHMQREPSVVVRSHQQEYHNSPTSVVGFESHHRSGLPQQTQTAEVGLQADQSFGGFAANCKCGPHWKPSHPGGLIKTPGTCPGIKIPMQWQSMPWISIGIL